MMTPDRSAPVLLPAGHPAARWWLALCLLGNLSLELLSRARADTAVRAAWPLLVGSGPNAAAVLAIAGAFVSLALASPPRSIAAWSAARRINATLVATMVGLLLWEFVQPFTRRGVFDWWDVLATVATGGLLLLVWPRVALLGGR